MTCGYGFFEYGQCGCGEVEGVFDTYGLETPNGSESHPGGLTRYAVIFPPRDTAGVPNTKTGFNASSELSWFIAPVEDAGSPATHFLDVGYGTLVGGAVPGTERVWSLESRTTDTHMACYDAISGEELFAHLIDFAMSVLIGVDGFNTAASATEFMKFQGGDFIIIDETGVTTTSSVTKTWADGDGGTCRLDICAPRNWPICAGVKTLTVSGDTTQEFFFGEAYLDGTVIKVDEGDRTIVKTIVTKNLGSDFAASWRMFDHTPTSWGGLIGYNLRPSTGSSDRAIHAAKLVNGSEVAGYNYTASSGGNAEVNALVSVCFGSGNHIHAVYNSDYVFSVEKIFSVAPSAGDPDGTGTTWEVVMYSGTSESWRSNPVGVSVGCRRSSDRWVYIEHDSDGTSSNGAMPNETFVFDSAPAAGGTPEARCWMVKPDGSQSIPWGYMDLTGNEVEPKIFPVMLTATRDCIKNSASLPGAPPADADDFQAILAGLI